MEQLQLPVYASCVSKEEPRMETILEIYNRIVGEELRPTTEEYRRAMRKGDPEVTARMKRTAFPALMPACVCAGFRRKECVTRYTGLCQVDFDKVPAERTHEVALRLKALPETLLLYRSMGNGLHLLYRYEGDYRQAFRQGNQYFAEQASLPYDPSSRSCISARYATTRRLISTSRQRLSYPTGMANVPSRCGLPPASLPRPRGTPAGRRP